MDAWSESIQAFMLSALFYYHSEQESIMCQRKYNIYIIYIHTSFTQLLITVEFKIGCISIFCSTWNIPAWNLCVFTWQVSTGMLMHVWAPSYFQRSCWNVYLWYQWYHMARHPNLPPFAPGPSHISPRSVSFLCSGIGWVGEGRDIYPHKLTLPNFFITWCLSLYLRLSLFATGMYV
jgi:hypothetical protein